MRKLVFLFVLFATFGVVVRAADVTFKASAPEAVVMGETFRLSYTVNAEGKDLRVPEIPDFDVLIGPSTSTSMSTQIVNGKMTTETSLTFTYILQPKKEGTFNIAPATIKVKGANYTSNALAIKVLPPDKADEAAKEGSTGTGISKDDAFLTIDVSKRNVYEQEGILVTFKLYFRKDIASINQPKFPEFDGFLAQEIELPDNKQPVMENYKGKNYNAVVIRQTVLYPQRSGKITIPSGKLDLVLRVPGPPRQRSSVFDDFFGGSSSYIDVKKELTTPSVTIDVKPLPSGKPASFSGAVGNFTMTSSINSNNVKTNEAVTVKVKISGNGNIKLVKNPEVVFPNDFEVYDPKVDVDIKTTAAGSSGTKTIEYMAIPRYAGDFEIPAIAFSYFDTKTNSYKTITSEPYKLHVEQGAGGGTSPVISNFSNKESVKYLGKDIRYLKVNDIHFVPNNELFFGSFMYYMCYLIPAILFIVFFFIYRKQVKENSNLALVRTKKANKMATRRLKNAGKLLKENKKEEFYDEVLRALWGYLSDKLSIPQASLTKDNVEAELTKYGVDEPLIHEFMDILNTCEFARYAPAQASDAMDKLYEQTVDAIGKMENTIKK
ncbi:protein BatD [Parabacteroides sp. AF48-14]|uniref:BatD family protein n=1 Tax=Parabacteroides sp. AF48-14 TaxID=2292052 RepID=UPI000EFDE40F|nr:BatD family protein [Parabacteroides sp. AF48-14]RHO74867.1 protein BatD [Parabacteroides sp. AF48-14]